MKFHDTLNEKLWNGFELKPEVKSKLNEITDAFKEYLDIPEESILDVRITGSSANYNYTEYSDLDLHLIVDYEKVHKDCPLVEKYLWSHKSIFNKDHDISIYGVQVELYAEDSKVEAISNGVYSLMEDKWIKKPEKIEPTDNDEAVQAKFEELKMACENCADSEVADELLDKIYVMRKAGLAEAGEFSTENMAFKLLRNAGIIEQLKELKKQKIDKELSLESLQQLNKELDKMNEELTFPNKGDKVVVRRFPKNDYTVISTEENGFKQGDKIKDLYGVEFIFCGMVSPSFNPDNISALVKMIHKRGPHKGEVAKSYSVRSLEYLTKTVNEATGYDMYGPMELPNKEDFKAGTVFYIEYNGGAGQIDQLVKARNGKFIWSNKGSGKTPFKTTDYDLAIELIDKFGGTLKWEEPLNEDYKKSKYGPEWQKEENGKLVIIKTRRDDGFTVTIWELETNTNLAHFTVEGNDKEVAMKKADEKLNELNEDLATLEKKMDNVEQEVKTMVKNIKVKEDVETLSNKMDNAENDLEDMVKMLNRSIKEALDNDELQNFLLYVQTTRELYDMVKRGEDPDKVVDAAIKLYNKEIEPLTLTDEDKEKVAYHVADMWEF